MDRGYQHNFSAHGDAMFRVEPRQRKARTMVAVLRDCLGEDLGGMRLLNVGGSAGIIDEYLSRYFGVVVGVDIDEKAIEYARQNFQRENLRFEVGDAMALDFPDSDFDVVVCSQVYEHVPDSDRMMGEIYRVLKPGGVCYFAAGNRLMWNEPHYNLPLLSVLPRFLAHRYIRFAGKADMYYEKHLSYWGLKRLVRAFEMTDYTSRIIEDPVRYHADYMLSPGSRKARLAALISRFAVWLVPGYIWLLRRPASVG